LAACSMPLSAAIDCYGGYVVRDSPNDARTSLEPKLANLSCPLLGLFGKDDQSPSPAEVKQLATLLRQHGKEFEFHSYDGAGHAFFAVDRPSYRVEAALDGWDKIADFLTRHLS
jgi:carboxymethylenebutenolidase